MVSSTTEKQREKFEQAKTKKFSDLAFDIAKAIVIGSLGIIIFEDWSKPYQKILILILGTATTSFFLLIALQYLKNHYLKHD